MARRSTKLEAVALIQALPSNAGWDEIMYELYVRQKIEAGIAAADAGDVLPHDAVTQRLSRPR